MRRVMAVMTVALCACGAVMAQGAPAAAPTNNSAVESGTAPASAPAKSESTVIPAKLVNKVQPVVQPAADGSSPGGTVVISYRILVDGTVSDVQFVSGPPELKDASIAAVKLWTYEPTRVSGHAVPSDATANLVFKAVPPRAPADGSGASPGGSTPVNGSAKAPTADGSSAGNASAAPPGADGKTAPSLAGKRVRVGGNVAAANLIHRVDPVYPLNAKADHVSGTVVLHALISTDGSIQDLKVVSGPDELTDAAVSAVKQWRYKPTTINGEPVEVDTTIAVVFTLGSKR